MTSTTTPLTREQALEAALTEALHYVLAATNSESYVQSKRAVEFLRRAREALNMPPTDLSGAMKYTGPGDAWPMSEGTKP